MGKSSALNTKLPEIRHETSLLYYQKLSKFNIMNKLKTFPFLFPAAKSSQKPSGQQPKLFT